MKLYDVALETFARSRVGGWMFVNVFNRVDRLWRAAVENYPGYADYQERTERVIPVMLLTPRS